MLPRIQAEGAGSQRVAVILKGRARGVSPKVLRRIGRLMPFDNLYVSRSLGDSSAIARDVVERGFDAVLLGGGDGTFVQCLTDLRTHARCRGAALPSLGVLRLGTGNAMASTLGASPPTVEGLRRDLARAQSIARNPLNLIEVDGRLTPFAGIGLDAQILEDFQAMTKALDAFGIGRGLGPGVRYALAVGLKSIPRFLARELQEVVAINLGSPAYRMGVNGERIGEPIAQGQILFRGRCSIASGSTIPYYGLGLKMFPFAQSLPDRFHLRCASSSAVEILGNLPSVWRGEYGSDTVGDFLVDKVELRLEHPAPIQIGGDLQPIPRDRLVLSLAPRAVTVIGARPATLN